MGNREQQTSSERVDVFVEVRHPSSNRVGRGAMNAMDTADLRDSVKVDLPSFQLNPEFKPVEMRTNPSGDRFEAAALRDPSTASTLIISGQVPKEKLDELKQHENVLDVFPNPKGVIVPMADRIDCNTMIAKGDLKEVARFLGVDKIWQEGFKGENIVIGIVDSGITAQGRASGGRKLVPGVIGGSREDWGKLTIDGHGNMTATDTLGMAPNAKVYDLRIFLREIEETSLDPVLSAYDWAIEQFRRTGTPQILSNSWGYGGPVEGVTDDLNHPVNRKILEAIQAGILVLFSAGNCGDPCFNPHRCSTHGPGASILGMNGHPQVMTVGAANIQNIRAGYSAQGPANFDAHKPDFCAPTHFKGYTFIDTGTSAACPIAAGVVALLKQAKPNLTQNAAKQALIKTATNLEAQGWDPNTGAGMIQAHAALHQLLSSPGHHPSAVRADDLQTHQPVQM